MIEIKSIGSTIFMVAVGLLAATGLFVAGEQAKPVEKIEDVINPAPAEAQNCPPGWEYTLIADHTALETCTKGDITVTLYPHLRKANYGLNTRNPNALPMACPSIPNWPRDWCIE
jgi:hypothetical protein